MALHSHTPKERARIVTRSGSGYYRTGMKEAKARAARIKERWAAAATPEGKEIIKKRLLAKKKTKEAGMTKQEKHSAERARVRKFELSREEQARGPKSVSKPTSQTKPKTPGEQAKPKTPGEQAKPKTPGEEHREAARERQGRWSIFPSLTGPDGALGGKK